MQKVPYQEHPPRYDYRLTAKGRDLWPVLNAMRAVGRPLGGTRRARRWSSCTGPVVTRSPPSCGAAPAVRCSSSATSGSSPGPARPPSARVRLPDRRPAGAARPSPVGVGPDDRLDRDRSASAGGRRRPGPVRLGASTRDYIAYHDDEWGRPVVDDVRLYEKLCLEGFQSGLSWLTILRKRPGFRAAFAGFDPEAGRPFGPADVERLLGDAGIVRHRGKIEATIANATRHARGPGRPRLAGRAGVVLRARPRRPPRPGPARRGGLHHARVDRPGQGAQGLRDSGSSAPPPPTPPCSRWAW